MWAPSCPGATGRPVWKQQPVPQEPRRPIRSESAVSKQQLWAAQSVQPEQQDTRQQDPQEQTNYWRISVAGPGGEESSAQDRREAAAGSTQRREETEGVR